MRMAFFWTSDLGAFFFENLKIETVKALTILCGVLAVFSLLYEGIKVYSASSRARLAREQIAAVSCAPSESANLLVTGANSTQYTFSKRFYRLMSETITFFFHNLIGYVVMLSVMAYSGWLFISVVLGMGVGYFFFGHIAMRINMETIQVRTMRIVCSPACPEAGSSLNASKNPSACRSVADNLDEGRKPGKLMTSSATCHENQAMFQSQVSSQCHKENEKTKAVKQNAEEDCCCRL